MKTLLQTASLSALSSCGKQPESGPPKVRIAIGGAQQLLYLPATLAERLEHYKDAGLDVTLESFPGGSKALEALMGGSADVVCGFYDHVIQMRAEGRKLIGFVLLTQFPGIVLAAMPGKATSIESLKGKTIGVTAPGSSTHLLLNYLLNRKGLAATDVSTVGIGAAATAVAAVEKGQVDAAILTEPALSELLSRIQLQILADTRTEAGVQRDLGVHSYPAASLYATEDWLTKNADTAHRLAGAMRNTLSWIGSHSSIQIAEAMPQEYLGPSKERYIASLEASRAMYSPDGKWTPEGAGAVKAVLELSMEKVKAAAVDVDQTYRNE